MAEGGLRLQGKVVLVTGGTAGIGRRIAELFLDAGSDVVVCARREPDTPVSSEGRTARFVAVDVRDPAATQALIDDIVDKHGALDVLINNAGGSPYVPLDKASPRFCEAIVSLNLVAPMVLSNQANAVMQGRSAGGVIVHITSVSGTRASPGTAAYGAAKAGLINLARSQAVEWAPKVRVNCVTAGLVRTDKSLDHYGGPEGLARVAATVPLGRMATPTDVAGAALYLASPVSAYVTGTQLVLDGGGEWPAFLRAAEATPRDGSTEKSGS